MLKEIGGFLASTASALVGDSLQKGRTEWNKEQDLDKMRKAPTAQVQGLQDAGLNPMLAYSKLDFGPVAPGPMAQINYAQDYASIKQAQAAEDSAEAAGISAAASAQQAATQAKLVDSTVERIKQEISNLQTDQEKAVAIIKNLGQEFDNLRVQHQVLYKTQLNLTDQGNLIRAQMDLARKTVEKMGSEIPLINQQAFRTQMQGELLKLEKDAATAFDNFGREYKQIAPIIDLLKHLFRPYGGHQ